MKTIIKFAMVSTVLSIILLTTTCKKQNQTKDLTIERKVSTGLSPTVYQKNLKHVPQKLFDLTSLECTKFIKQYKSSVKSQNQAARIVDVDSLSLDSATWVLEAILNYDFDFQSESTYNKFFTLLSTTIAVNNDDVKVNSNDLEFVYEAISARIDSLINDSIKISFIDIEGYIYDPGTGVGVFGLKIQSLNSAHVVECHVPSYYISGASPCILPSSSSYYNTHFGCNPTGNVYNACTLLNISSNCFTPSYSGGCGRWFWYSITPGVSFFPDYNSHANTYSSSLYYSGLQTNSYFCPPICLTSTQLDNYYYGAISLGNSIAPTGFVLLYFGYAPQGIVIHSSSNTMAELGWDLNIQHGRRMCLSELPD